LKKHAAETTRQIRDKKRGLQDRLADEANLIPTFEAWERERKEKLKPLLKVKTEENDAKKKEISEEYAEKFDEFREDLEERYEAEKRQLLDYPIFMAIADNIGYDAAGKNTYRILSREEYEDAGGAKFIKEIQQNDLFTTELVKRREFKDGKDTETTVSETVMPDAGIAGELRAFIELIETGQDHFFVSALS
jgi:type I restriction enzyme M protein